MRKIYNKDDGNFYFQDENGDWVFAPSWGHHSDNRCIYDEACYVKDMKSDGVSEEDIARVNDFINSIKYVGGVPRVNPPAAIRDEDSRERQKDIEKHRMYSDPDENWSGLR
tara:strand:+ start:134 stop:466 length:333 start_codon:yes stop_codon:yes gene_type:complete